MLKTYLEISLGMSAIILLALSFTPFLKKRYRAGARYAIWIICAVALLVPFKPSPKITIEIPQIKHEAAASTKLTDDVTYAVPKSDEAVPEGIADMNIKSETAYVQPLDEKTSEPIDVWAVLTAVWLFGAAAFMLYYIAGYAVFLRKIRPWCRKFEFEGYKEKPRLVYCRLVKSPMLTGFFEPRILLPRNDYSDMELSMILKHELTHYKRGDLWAKLLFIAVNAIHWFNPVVYVMRKAANRDMEYSCDERVVKDMDRKFCQDYSIAILRCAAGVGMCTAFSTHFSEDKEKLRQRLKNILSGRKKRGIIIGAITLMLAVTCAGVFGFTTEKTSDNNNTTESVVFEKKSLKERYIEIYKPDDTENLYAPEGANFCMPIPEGVKIEEYDLNGETPNGVERLWNVTSIEGEMSIKIIDKVIDLPGSEEVLKQRFYNTPWGEGMESPYAAGKYTISDFRRFLFTVNLERDDGILGYRYMVNFSEGGSCYVREWPISDTKTLRIVADIKTSDEQERKNLIEFADSVKVVKYGLE